MKSIYSIYYIINTIMCMYFTKGINQDGYILCRYCNMMKDNHPIFTYLYNMTSQCDDIILLIQDYVKVDIQTINGGVKNTSVLLQDNTVKCWGNKYYQATPPPSNKTQKPQI